MKKLVLLILMMTQFGFSQVGINTTTPNAQLDIKSSNQLTPSNTDGILIPKIDAFPLINPTVLQQGMMVYLTTISAGKSPGFYYWDNATVNWIGLGGSGAGTGWLTTGNTGTSAATNFIGTTDNNDVVFKRFNSKAGLLGGYITGFGTFSLNANTTGNGNTAFGAYSLLRNTTGSNNLALGSDAMSRIVEGSNGTSIGYASMFYFSGPNTPFVNTNTAIGYYSMLGEHSGSLAGSNNVGLRNTAVGYQVLEGISSGNDNTALGYRALNLNGKGVDNTAIGSNTLQLNTTASKNIAVGKDALFSQNFANGNVIYDTNNIALGYNALFYNNPTGNWNGKNNIAIGVSSVVANSIGMSNIGIGTKALEFNTTGNNNIAIGEEALNNQNFSNSNTVYDTNNIAIGRNSLRENKPTSIGTGVNNVGLGYATLGNNLIGSDNTALGTVALNRNTTGNNNVGIGRDASFYTTTGSNNVAIGYKSFETNIQGSNATAIGYGAMKNANSTNAAYINSNVAIGYEALRGSITTSNNTGIANTAIGYQSLYSNSTGAGNLANGREALYLNTTGSSNVAIGAGTLRSNSTGNGNIAIGDQAGFSETGSNKLYIENSNSATPLIYGEFNNDLLRFHGNLEVDNITTANNKMQLVNKNNYTHAVGNQVFGSGGDDFLLSSQEGTTESGGIYGDGNAISIWSPGDANGGQSSALVYFMDEDNFDNSNNNPYDTSTISLAAALKSYISPAGVYFQVSDKNKKENISKIENASEKIDAISGYTYQFKLAPEEVKKGDKPIKSSGVLAQELEKVLPEAVQKNEKGEYFVDYAAITPLLIEAIKDQNAKIKALESSQNEILKRLDMLEKK